MSVLADLPRRTQIAAVLGVVSVLCAGVAFSFGPLVRSGVASAAARRGVQVEVGQVRLGWRGIWLRDLTVRVPSMPAVTARIAAARVGLGWHFNVSELAIHGAFVEATGDAETLERQYAAYRAARPKSAGGGAGPRYVADGVDLRWSPGFAATPHYIWGLHYERADGHESVGLDLARIRVSGIEVEALHPQARLRFESDERKLESLQSEGLNLGISLESTAERLPDARAAGSVKDAPAKPRAFQPDPLR